MSGGFSAMRSLETATFWPVQRVIIELDRLAVDGDLPAAQHGLDGVAAFSRDMLKQEGEQLGRFSYLVDARGRLGGHARRGSRFARGRAAGGVDLRARSALRGRFAAGCRFALRAAVRGGRLIWTFLFHDSYTLLNNQSDSYYTESGDALQTLAAARPMPIAGLGAIPESQRLLFPLICFLRTAAPPGAWCHRVTPGRTRVGG